MSLRQIMAARISATGPISVAEYMAECLLHPEYGYYVRHDPFGAEGDFVTSPEISQMFGEMVGLCLAQAWMDQGAPAPFTLFEPGPGRGTLMADIWRATKGVPGFHEAAQVVLFEASGALREVQAKTLEMQAIWIEALTDLPRQAIFCVANEFLDALPIRQFIRAGEGWRERQVGAHADKLIFGLGPAQPQPALAHRLEDTRDGDLVEDCPALAPFVAELGQRIETHGGAALIIDYGDWRSLGDTLQALRAHQREDALAHPGEADLTAHVDFEAVAAAAPCAHTRLTPQGIFLERLGITSRAQALATRLTGAALNSHIAAHRRLTHPDEMGTLFKVIGLHPVSASPLPGFTHEP